MKKITLIILSFIILFPFNSFGQQKSGDTIKLYYLGGQSNMDGLGLNSELPESLKKPFNDIYIFHGNLVGDDMPNGGLGKWEKLEPGHGAGFSTDGKTNRLSDRFGVELSFAKKIQELYPNDKIAIIKYSRGGTAIDSQFKNPAGCWDPNYKGTAGINQYDHFLTTLRNAFDVKDINGDGKEDRLIPSGIIWMQGESDACYGEEVANRYYSNLKQLMDLIRAALRTDDLPVVIGKISDSNNNKNGKIWPYGELVQYGQEKYARTDDNAAIVRDTKHYKYSDAAHYDSAGFIDLGEKFAESVYKLNKGKK